MKTCPECAEEIQDAATKCRYCGSDVRPAAPAVPGLVFNYLGPRYMLGTIVAPTKKRAVAIWDRSIQGPPVERFPPNAAGWQQGLERFVQLEPSYWANENPPACPTCSSLMDRPQASDQTRRMATGFLLFGVIGALASSGGGAGVSFICRRDGTQL